MQIEVSVDRNGLFWSGLGLSLHLEHEPAAPGLPLVWWRRSELPGSRSFRLGGLEGVISRTSGRRSPKRPR